MFKSEKFQEILSSALTGAGLKTPDMWAGDGDLLIESWRVINASAEEGKPWAKEALMAVLAMLWEDTQLADKRALRSVQLFDGEEDETHFREFLSKCATYYGRTPNMEDWRSDGQSSVDTPLLPQFGACRRCRSSTCPVGPEGYCSYCRDENEAYE